MIGFEVRHRVCRIVKQAESLMLVASKSRRSIGSPMIEFSENEMLVEERKECV